jgi:ABC-type branched-subunit amino acid transport system substrate-binding protein
MKKMNKAFSSHRRQLLCAVGGAALTMSPLAKAAFGAMDAPLRVGIVLPQSIRYPELSRQILAGFQAYAATPGGRSLALLPIATGSGPRAGLDAATKAAQSGSVDVLAGMVDRNSAFRIRQVLEDRGTPFVVCDMGADIVRDRRESKYLIRSSLGYWQSNFALGRWAPANLGARAVIATDFLESGHDMVYAFRRAFEEAGGEVLDVQVTGIPDGTKGFAKVGHAVRSQRPDFVYAFYSGKRADTFLRYYEGDGLSRVAPLAGPALLTDSAVSAGTSSAALPGITTVSPWAPDHESVENGALQSAFREFHGSEAGLFALLGYETAQRIATGVAAVGGNISDSAAFAKALAGASFASPRGPVAPLEGMSESSAPAYVRRVSRAGERLAHVTTARLPALEMDETTGRELRAMIKTGWAHAYLAA